ncbi:hypothetical protein SNE25_15930 [Mucilaginibacter sabulilitoris]|uniref:Sulfotransferase family protein n=1 Tax=Mucilaginibacter sabulilitoris TaxID=1173583 RepID=A0ABZ0TW70_9SPHI|nr:hypothetical protein [Mucilaginibacter sabulilitoris]WPU97011.1 hypothetical protein SNE25_15930 [Mucilaginibacter sabulilitoris]
MSNVLLKDWIPYKLENTAAQIQCSWLNTYAVPFTEPFFDDTINKCKRMNGGGAPFASISGIDVLTDWAAGLAYVEPSAFIFHISRCGSTLVSQLLATSAANIVLSEVPFFDALLRLPYQVPGFNENNSADLLAAAIKFYGQKRTGHERHLFIKTDSWHIFFHKQFRILYPDVPIILIYRSPYEVLASHLKMPGMQAIPGFIEPEIFGFKPGELTYNRPDIYTAQVLERYLNQYHEIIATDNKCLLLNYNEGPMAMIKQIVSFTNTPLNEQGVLTMDERSRYHSKKPNELFSETHQHPKPHFLNNAMALYHSLNSM